ncbi:DUF4142 domain-containing protein [Sphingomonas xinjiangensis]|uniref:Putative membrane protein n=1 Tax=Sphingomonas xinjiangensis TaxID=643568 RepID=A0A840YL30_9SPHN|nr:DUF4142 domain-containing protein [Sphingomonas xinjiangensis]MBB5709890.1 putative membrane protein [Sphingomonas xinjiangensis]
MKHLLISTSLLVAAIAAPAVGSTPAVEAQASRTPTKAAQFVPMAASSDMYEIESSRLALERSQSPAIKQFAQMMIDHHTMTTQQVTQAAQASGMTPPPPALLPPHRTLLDKLQPAQGRDFDRMYLDQQRTAHRQALALHQTYSRRGDKEPLRQAAAGAVPIVQQHIDQLKTLSPT